MGASADPGSMTDAENLVAARRGTESDDPGGPRLHQSVEAAAARASMSALLTAMTIPRASVMFWAAVRTRGAPTMGAMVTRTSWTCSNFTPACTAGPMCIRY